MFKGKNEKDIPEDRFYEPPTSAPCGEKQHHNYIKLRKNKIVKHFIVEQKNVEQMIDEFNEQLQEKEKIKIKKDQFVLVANNAKTNVKVPVNMKTSASLLFEQGLNQIEVQSAVDSKGLIKYPEIPCYIQTNQYFSNIQKLQSKVQDNKPKDISIKLVLQACLKADKMAQVTINTSQTIRDLKNKAKQVFGIVSIQNILLEDMFTMIFQKDKNTIAQQDFKNGDTVYVRIVQFKACYPADSKIKVLNNKIVQQKYISQVEIGDLVLSYNQKGYFQEDEVTYVKQMSSNVLMEIKVEDNKLIKSTPGDLYLTEQGWKKYDVIGKVQQDHELREIKLSQNDRLVYCNENKENYQRSLVQYEKIQSIEIIVSQIPVPLYHLSIRKNHTYIVNGFVVHNMQIQVQDPSKGQSYKIDSSALDLILTLKKKVAIEIKLKIQQFTLLFAQKQLQDKKSLNDYKIGKGDKLQIKRLQKKLQKIEQINPIQKWIVIKDKQKSYNVKYQSVKNKYVSKVLDQIKKNCPKHYSLMVGDLFLGPMSLMSEIEKDKNFKDSNKIHCILVKSAQKKLFYEWILTKDYTNVIQSYKDPNKKKKLMQKFRNSKQNKSIMDFLFRFDPSDQSTCNQKQFLQTRQVVLWLMSFQKYQNSTTNIEMKLQSGQIADIQILEYDVYKKQRFNSFNKMYKKGQVCYFKEFLQTKTKNYKQVIEEKPAKQTVYLIRSLSGRKLGKINEDQTQEQVIFLPFTYFIVDEIILDAKEKTTVQIVFLTEMETLFNYKNPFLLWVDDLPNNRSNKKIYEDLVSQNPGLQIMKLVSTKQALQWMNEFAWLVNWQNIRFKMISDMTRFQVDPKNQKKLLPSLQKGQYIQFIQKSSAAIDLIQRSCDHQGFTTLITIFCLNKQNADKRVNDRNLKQGLNYHQITIDMEELKSNINDFLKGKKQQKSIKK